MRGPGGWPFVRSSTARLGALAGVVMGLLWIAEISFNNFVPPTISTGGARFYVDNSVWAAISLATVVLSGWGAYCSRRIGTGVSLGFWSGLVSGALAGVMGVLLATVWVSIVAQDPLMIAEFAARAPASAGPDLEAYVRGETLAGAIGHLTVLGFCAGTILGVVGGALGRGLAALRATSSTGWPR